MNLNLTGNRLGRQTELESPTSAHTIFGLETEYQV